jgi:hypothetical protein
LIAAFAGSRISAAFRDGDPFGVAGIWENWRDPWTDAWERTFVVITVPANQLVTHAGDIAERTVFSLAERRSGSARPVGAIPGKPARGFAASTVRGLASRPREVTGTVVIGER